MRFLPRLVSVAKPVQGARFRAAAEMRHVRGRAGAGAAEMRGVVH